MTDSAAIFSACVYSLSLLVRWRMKFMVCLYCLDSTRMSTSSGWAALWVRVMVSLFPQNLISF